MLQRVSQCTVRSMKPGRLDPGARSFATFLTTPIDVGGENGITFQKDITVENLRELTDIFYADTNMSQAHIFSENNLRAMTVASDYPWSTARTLEGKLVACVIGSHVGDAFFRSTGLFVLPEYRSNTIAPKLTRYCIQESLSNYPLGNASFVTTDGINIGHSLYVSDKVDEWMSVRVGKADKYNPKDLPETGTGFSIVPFQRGLLFDKLVFWDTMRVHWIPRPVFLKSLLTPGVVDCYVALDNKTKDVVGYGAIQLAFNTASHILGPLYGENDEIALVLLRKLMEHYKPGNNIGLMHFDGNKTIAKVMEDIGLGVRLKAISRYTGTRHPEHLKQQVYMISNCGTQFN